jgi:hypothetical protein
MTALSVKPPFPVITDTNGQPLEDGFIYIGIANQDPVTNPITVYWDAALTIPASQPIRTLAGYPSRSGTPAVLYVNSNYSITVKNKNNALVYQSLSVTERVGSEFVTFIQAGLGAVQRTAESKLRELVSVKDFGAVGNGIADDTAAIQAALDALSSTPALIGRVLYFPSGIYRTTSTLLIDSSGFALEGANEKGAISFSPIATAGSHILYDSNDGGPILKIGANTAYRFHNKISKLRVGAASGLSVKPVGIQLNTCSEFTLSQFHVNGGCSVGLALNACTIGRVQNFDVAVNDVGIDLYVDTAVVGATANVAIGFLGANVWQSAEDAVRVRGTSTNIVFRDSWFEFAQNIFHFVQQSNVAVGVGISLQDVTASVGGGGALDSRFIRCRAFDGGNTDLRVRLSASNCQTFNNASTHNIVYTKGTNSSVNSILDQAQFENCTFYGASTAVLNSDVQNSTVFFTGRTLAFSGFASGSVIPLVDGSARLHRFTSENGFWDMVGSYPIRLPTVDALSFTTAGQFYYQSTRNRLAFTANGNRILLPRPLVVTYGDEDVTVDVMVSAETLRFNTPLTANKAVTLSTTNAYNGAKFRVFRTAAATGAFDLDVGGGLKILAAGQWCDVEHDGAAWRLTASGSL